MPLLSIAVKLFLIVNAIGCVPIFLSLMHRYSDKKYALAVIREVVVAWALICFFALLGRQFMHAIHVSDAALTLGGGVVLFLIALKLIFPSDDGGDFGSGEPFIVPLAMPLMAGFGSLATVMSMSVKLVGEDVKLLIGISLAMFLSGVLLFFGRKIQKLCGEKTLTALSRLVGMLISVMGVQMILDGCQMAKLLYF